MWQGILGLKNDNCVVQMHFIAGCRPLVKLSLPQQGPDGTVQPLRIAQRMRLEQAQLDGVAKRMQVSFWLSDTLNIHSFKAIVYTCAIEPVITIFNHVVGKENNFQFP